MIRWLTDKAMDIVTMALFLILLPFWLWYMGKYSEEEQWGRQEDL